MGVEYHSRHRRGRMARCEAYVRRVEWAPAPSPRVHDRRVCQAPARWLRMPAVRTLLRVAIALVLLAVAAWFSLALRFRLPEGIGIAVSILYLLGVVAALVWLRPFGRAVLAIFATFLVLAGWWSTIRPSNDRDWAREYAKIPYGELDGDLLTLHNVRNFDYRSETDFTDRWETRTFDLSKLSELDLFMSYWGSPYIAHTILSWGFTDGPPLAVSIETRRERTESYSALRGFFREI